MIVLIKTLQVILALSLLIFIHELGHFTFAKLFGIRVDKFFLFFDAGGFKLFSTKDTKWFARLFPKIAASDTEYGIGWLPLGGYCKICGMIDESLDMDQLKQEPKPWEFRTKKAWKRLLVMAGGVMYNFFFAVIAYSCILGIWGQSYYPNEVNAIYVNDLAYDMGFRNGDRILSFDDYVPENFNSLQVDLARRSVHKATVLRGCDTLVLYIDQSMIGAVLNTPGMFDLAVPFTVDSVDISSPNSLLRKGDKVLSLNGITVPFFQDSRQVLAELAGTMAEATVLRDADTLTVPVQVDSSGRIGVYLAMPPYSQKEYGFFSSIPAGVKMTFSAIGSYLQDLKLVATPRTQAYKSVGSFIAIGQVFPSAWDWYQFLQIVALLSIMLGVMNLIPIPGLDGGHILFTLFEMLTGRKPSDKFLMVAQMIGMMLLFALMFLAFGNDIGRLLK
ncbi:MAG: RIP metalloprotease RseP [Bacteroidales bacterium]|nr:RIP metalloprotease RseP [Bacteroidales bacterium]